MGKQSPALSAEDQAYIKQLEEELNIRDQQQNYQQSNLATQAMFGQGNKPNLVEWQLDFKAELEDIEHLLRCDILITDSATGNQYWKKNPDKSRVFLNDLGVNDLLREVRMFLNKNTVLSNYQLEEIRPRLRQLGHELRMLIFNNAEEYEIDNEYKANNYPIVVLTILAMFDSAYRRALNGEERRDLNSARIVQQTEQPMMQYQGGMIMPGQNNKGKGGFSKIFPWNWK